MYLGIIVVVLIIALIIYGGILFLTDFYEAETTQQKSFNYAVKGLMFLLAIIASIIVAVTEKSLDFERAVLLFVSSIEAVSCFGERKKLKEKDETKNKQYKWAPAIAMAGLLVMLGAPYAVAKLVEASNAGAEWIEFWGGYIGAIFGGLITFIVLHCTIKDGKSNLLKTFYFDNEKTLAERKIKFIDELLKEMVQYQTGINDIYNSLRRKQRVENFMVYVQLSKVIMIKLESKKEDASYKFTNEMLCSIQETTTNINEYIEMVSKELDGVEQEGLKAKEDEIGLVIEQLIRDIETYYVANQYTPEI